MARPLRLGRRAVAVLVVVVVVLGVVPGVAAAETRSGGSVVIAEGETVSDLTAFGGTVVVRGTVEGDLTAFAGNVMIEPGAEVTGDVEATAGNVRTAGSVGGDVTATGGNLFVANTATIGGNVEAAAGTVVIAGAVSGNAELAGGSVTLVSTATIDGDVEYAIGEDGEFTNDGTVGGSVTRNDDLSVGGTSDFQAPELGAPVFGIYGFLVNVVVGALLLLVLPDTSRRIADRVTEQPLRTGAIGLVALVGVPVGLVLVAITIIGIPVMLAGIVAYALAVWIGTIYGRYAVGELLLSYTDTDNRWVALVAGAVVVAVLGRIPFVGGLFELAVLLLGLGAMAALAYRALRDQRDPAAPEPSEGGATPG